MGTDLMLRAAVIILPFVFALASYGTDLCEKRNGFGWQCAAIMSVIVATISFLCWLSGSFYWMYQNWNNSIRSIYVPSMLFLVMPAIACGIIPKDNLEISDNKKEESANAD